MANLLAPKTIDWTDDFSTLIPDSEPKTHFFSRAWFPWIVALVILIVLGCIFSPLVIVTHGHRGIATFFGEVEGDLYAEGLHFKYPLLRVHQFDVRNQVDDVSVGVVTKDMQLVTVSASVTYHLDEQILRQTYDEVGRDVEKIIVTPAAKEALNVAVTKFTASELVSDRNDLRTSIQAELENRLLESGVLFDDLAIVEVNFSKTLKEAFEAKATAEVRAKTAELDSQTAVSQIKTAETLSTSELERIRTIGQALRGNEIYIQYELLQKWDGKSALYLVPSSTVPLTSSSELKFGR